MAEFTFPGIRVLLLCFFFLPLFRLLHSEPTQDREALLDFISSVRHSNRIQWSANQSACNWVGVGCDPNQSSVFSLRLPAAGLVGSIPANTIGRLSQLRVLSLRLNGLSGQIPSDFSNLKLLRSLYLQGNQFSGEFPIGIPELTGLTRLDLSGNNFFGSLPFALNNLTTLTVLFLENNGFSGDLTSINITSLTEFNISNNQINGSIPDSLSGFPASAFAGNIGLCGGPLPPCGETPPPSSPPGSPIGKKSSKLSTAAIVGISIGAGFLLLLLLLLLIVCLRRRKRRIGAKTQNPSPVGAPAATSLAAGVPSSSREIDMTSSSAEGADRTKLVFFAGGNYKFDLEDLLRASAEVLGKGTVGTSYKAVLEEGTVVVVKRLRDVVVSKKDFESQMEIIGKIRINDNVNVVSLQAYYYSKDEKLLVSDYIAAGSLSSLLHGSRGSGRTPLNWDSRVKIAIGAGRGLASLHVSGNVVHGNIKASNILLRSDHVAAVSDFGLNPLFGTGMPPNRVAGYRAPEMVETRKPSFKSDVYSFGVLLLELLTGKSPTQASLGDDEGVDLPRWVQSVVREEWTAEVFDVELMRYQNIEEEMVQLLQIAMTCVSPVPDQRPRMPDVVRMIEELPMNRTPAAADTDDVIRQSSDEPSRESDGLP